MLHTARTLPTSRSPDVNHSADNFEKYRGGSEVFFGKWWSFEKKGVKVHGICDSSTDAVTDLSLPVSWVRLSQ